MKKLITLMLAVCLVFAMVGIYASAETLDGVEDLATYTAVSYTHLVRADGRRNPPDQLGETLVVHR